jgi:hypothetical protein
VPWLKHLVAGLSPWRPGFAPGSVHVVFVVGEVALGQFFLRVLRSSPVSIIPPWLSMLTYHLADNSGPVGGRSSETQFHPIDTNKVVLVRNEGSLHEDVWGVEV